ncbi:MAG: hypothetical protein WCP16_09980 [Pseudanabaena sp. ELA645]|jgi:hypothetical protein
MSRFERFKEHLLNSFDRLNEILEIELRDEFSIIDIEDKRSFIVVDKNLDDNTFIICHNGINIIQTNFDITKLFNIKNAQTVGFVPIDGTDACLMQLLEIGEKRCDFVFFDENNLCFVELKLNATSIKPRSMRVNRTNAIEQLKKTIALFDRMLGGNYEGLGREAYVCTPKVYPPIKASGQNLAQRFLEEVGIKLFEKNEKSCG